MSNSILNFIIKFLLILKTSLFFIDVAIIYRPSATWKRRGNEGWDFYSLWCLYCNVSSIWIRSLYQGEGGKKNKMKRQWGIILHWSLLLWLYTEALLNTIPELHLFPCDILAHIKPHRNPLLDSGLMSCRNAAQQRPEQQSSAAQEKTWGKQTVMRGPPLESLIFGFSQDNR